jgi:3-hydroxyisobutyrate dehydrogenase
MATGKQTIGWIGMGRMGYAMAEWLLKAGYDVTIWNRTKAKAEPLTKLGGKVVDKLSDLSGVDVLFCIVSAGKDVKEVLFGPNGVAPGGKGKMPKIVVDCSTISVDDSVDIREQLTALGTEFVACPVSGNAKVINAGKLSAVASGPEAAFRKVEDMVLKFAPNGVSYVGDGELARICKIAHNVMLGVVIQNLIEITLLSNKMGVPREAFLRFMSNSVMGSMFTRYKSPALVNLDWTTTFTPELLLKDLDLGLELGREWKVPMPVTATTREIMQGHIGNAILQADPKAYLEKDFATLMETMAAASGMKIESEKKNVPTGLE